MHVIYLLLNLYFNSDIKFKFKLYTNYIKIVYIIILYFIINQYIMYIINWNHESEIYINDTHMFANNLRHILK